MDHAWLGNQYLIRGMVLTQQLHEKEIINTMDQKTNKNPRDVHGERKLSKLQDKGIFLSAVKASYSDPRGPALSHCGIQDGFNTVSGETWKDLGSE